MPLLGKRENEIISHVTSTGQSLYTSSFGLIQDYIAIIEKVFLDDQKKKIDSSLSFSAFSRRINPRMQGRIEYTLNCKLEVAPMIRILGLTVCAIVPLCLATTARAQTAPYNVGAAQGPNFGVSFYGVQPYGGFGLGYTQTVPAGSMVMDQYGLWHAVPYFESAPPVAAAQPQTQPRSRTTRSASRRVAARVAQPRYQLPTGSLGMSGANGGMLYSPGARYQSYGSGYGWPGGRDRQQRDVARDAKRLLRRLERLHPASWLLGYSKITRREMAMRGCSAWLPVVAVFTAMIGLGWGAPEASAQAVVGGPYSSSYRVSDYLGAPGLYGMSYGFASYGMPQTYTVFSAYPGPSYGSNYPPYGILPGRYGVGLCGRGSLRPATSMGPLPSPTILMRQGRTLTGRSAWETVLAIGRHRRRRSASTRRHWDRALCTAGEFGHTDRHRHLLASANPPDPTQCSYGVV